MTKMRNICKKCDKNLINNKLTKIYDQNVIKTVTIDAIEDVIKVMLKNMTKKWQKSERNMTKNVTEQV